jgi:processive 1,2-diacylglycerol beta-glucosyltransferase
VTTAPGLSTVSPSTDQAADRRTVPLSLRHRADPGVRSVRRPGALGAPVGSGRVLVLSATVGQGHEGAARELGRRLTARGLDVEVFDYLDALPAPLRRVLKDLYRPTVQYAPRLFDSLFRRLEHRGGLRATARWVCRRAEPEIERRARGADLVLSTYPLAGQTVGELRAQRRLAGTAITYLTDPAAHALWCHPGVDRHLTATAPTAAGARRYGVDAVVAGPLCDPRFDRAVGSGRRVREQLGLPASAPVVLLSAGSLGMGDVPGTVAAALTHPQARVVVLCGRNEALRRRLEVIPRVTALGWRGDVPELMGAADVLIHNAGGLSFTEALVAGLPALTYLPIPGHGEANAAQLEQSGVAPWPRNPAQLTAAIDEIQRAPRRAPRPWPMGADPADVVVRSLDRTPSPGALASGF